MGRLRYGTGCAGSLTNESLPVVVGAFSDSTPLAWKYSAVVVASRGGQALNVRHVLLPLSNTVASAGTYAPVPFRYMAKNGASIFARYSTPVAAPKSILPSVRPSRRQPP